MGNIKQRLEADANMIVQSHRDSGGELDDHVAKYASSKGYKGDQVRSLTALVNRRAFKAAMLEKRDDEPQVANAEAVLMRMRGGTEKVAAQVTSHRPFLGGSRLGLDSGHSARVDYATDYGPFFRSKLAAREQELGSDTRVLNARLREAFFDMERLSQSIKLAGLEESERFKQAAFAGCNPEALEIIERVLAGMVTEKVAMADTELRHYIPRAVEDGKRMAVKAAAIVEDLDRLLDTEARIEKAGSIKRDLADGLEV